MSTIKKLVLTLFFFHGVLFFSNRLMAQVPDEIIQSFKSGDAKTLSTYFNQNVELVVLENDNAYSKAQAQQIVSKFFSSNKPESFNVIHQSSAEGAQLIIGNLVTKNGSFRVYFMMRKNAGKDYIHQLRIEEPE
jgi:hypothetical protein